jgi:hypothetical protein
MDMIKDGPTEQLARPSSNKKLGGGGGQGQKGGKTRQLTANNYNTLMSSEQALASLWRGGKKGVRGHRGQRPPVGKKGG